MRDSSRPGSRVPLLEVDFFIRDPVRRALAQLDFGYVFRAVRRAAGLTQEELGELLELDQDRISRIERGERPLSDVKVIIRVANRLGIPAVLIGFRCGDGGAVKVEEVDSAEEDWVKRRDFPQILAAITFGVTAVGLDLDRLVALLALDSEAQRPGRVGGADVEAIERLTAVLRGWDFSAGGGRCWGPAVAQFRSALPLLHATCTEPVRHRLLVATADLGMTAAFSAYDVERHNLARRLWARSLIVVRAAEHPAAADLTANLLMDVANQACHLGRPQEALSLVQLGYGAGASRGHPVLPSTASRLKGYEAWFQATLGEVRCADRARGQAIDHFTLDDPTDAPPWAAFVTPAELTALQGHVRFTLALGTADAKHAAQAVPLLREAVDGFGAAYARFRAVNLPGLAGAHVLAGDLRTGVQVGHQAVEEITALASPRIYQRLRTLDTVLARRAAEPAVAELRGRIDTALAVA